MDAQREASSPWPLPRRALPHDPALERRVEAWLAALTLEQKVGQMVMGELQFTTPEDVRTHALGAVLNGGGSTPGADKRASVGAWADSARAFHEAGLELPALGHLGPVWGTDAVHGHNNVHGATVFPHNIGLGAAGDPELVRAIAAATAREVAATGVHWAFAPTLAVVRDDRWGRTYEAFAEDPEVVAAMAGPAVRGLQGDPGLPDFLGPDRVLACAKHWLGDGGTARGIDQGDTRVDEDELALVHGAGYIEALGAGAQTVMVSFSSWNGEKLHGHRYLLTDVLKGRLGFDGIVVTDWNGHGQVPGCSNTACAAAINAGCDMLMAPEDWRELLANTINQVRDGVVPMARIDDAVRRILRVKLRAGLDRRSFAEVRGHAGDAGIIGCAAHRELARRAVRESLVLLKNRGGLLPLRPTQRIGVAGAGADDIGMQCGGWTLTWQGDGNSNADFPGATSIAEGLRQAVHNHGGEVELAPDGRFAERPDVAVVVFGEDPYAEGVGDRAHLSHSATKPDDLALLRQLQADGIPVVGVLLTGRPLWVNPELNACDAFVVAWLPGSEGGGVADVLVADGQGQPCHPLSGRLRFSWPADALQTTANLHDNQQPLCRPGAGLGWGDDEVLAADLPEDDSAGDQQAGDGVLALFSARAVPPLGLFVGDSSDSQVPVSGVRTDSPVGVVSVMTTDRQVQGDARRVTFSGTAAGQAYLHALAGLDLALAARAGGRLEVAVRVDEAPTAAVHIGLSSGVGYEGRIEVTRELAAAAGDGWQVLALELRAFGVPGLRFDHVITPFRLVTAGRLVLAFADVRVVLPEALDG